jgi:hypothetical protein
MFRELSISTQPGRKIAGAVSSLAACSLTAAATPPSETETDDAAFPLLTASYCYPPPDFLSPGFQGASVEFDEERELSEARRVAVMVRYFRCL